MSTSISSQQDVMKLLFNVTRFEMQYPRFIEESGRQIIDQEILQPIKIAMRSFGYSEKIIDGTFIDNLFVDGNGFIQFDVVSDYKTELGCDVAKAREEGTKDHFIKPVKGKVLSWIEGGQRFFSKGHFVKGITERRIMERTVRNAMPDFLKKFKQEIEIG